MTFACHCLQKRKIVPQIKPVFNLNWLRFESWVKAAFSFFCKYHLTHVRVASVEDFFNLETWSILTEKTILDSKKDAISLKFPFIAQSQAVSPFLFSSYKEAPEATKILKIKIIFQVKMLQSCLVSQSPLSDSQFWQRSPNQLVSSKVLTAMFPSESMLTWTQWKRPDLAA